MCSEVLRLILSQDYSWEGENFTSWKAVSGGPPNSIRTLLAAVSSESMPADRILSDVVLTNSKAY